jgi:hypothetical protein
MIAVQSEETAECQYKSDAMTINMHMPKIEKIRMSNPDELYQIPNSAPAILHIPNQRSIV